MNRPFQAAIATLWATGLLLSACKSDDDPIVKNDTHNDSGAPGTGGANATGGTSSVDEGVVANCPVAEPLFMFDNDANGFAEDYISPSTLTRTVVWDGTEGNPTSGSLSLSADFNGPEQTLMVAKNYSKPYDLTGHILTAMFRLDDDPSTGPGNFTATGGTPEQVAGARLFIKTGQDYIYADNGWVNLARTGWFSFVFDPTSPGYVSSSDASALNITDIRQLGIAISTGSSPGTFTHGSFHFDSLMVQEGTSPGAPPWTFDCTTENFNVTYLSHSTLQPTLNWSNDVGSPVPGSLKLSAQFSTTSQEIGLGRVVTGNGVNLSAKTLTAKVRVASGIVTSSAHPATAKLYVAAGDNYVCGIGAPVDLDLSSDWTTATINVDNPSYKCPGTTYDASRVLELGIIFDTGSAGSYQPGVLYVDTITAI